jgi:hypothetical protein
MNSSTLMPEAVGLLNVECTVMPQKALTKLGSSTTATLLIAERPHIACRIPETRLTALPGILQRMRIVCCCCCHKQARNIVRDLNTRLPIPYFSRQRAGSRNAYLQVVTVRRNDICAKDEEVMLGVTLPFTFIQRAFTRASSAAQAIFARVVGAAGLGVLAARGGARASSAAQAIFARVVGAAGLGVLAARGGARTSSAAQAIFARVVGAAGLGVLAARGGASASIAAQAIFARVVGAAGLGVLAARGGARARSAAQAIFARVVGAAGLGVLAARGGARASSAPQTIFARVVCAASLSILAARASAPAFFVTGFYVTDKTRAALLAACAFLQIHLTACNMYVDVRGHS